MKYSIITSVYNSGEYIEEYFKNIKDINYTDFEVVIVDDNSKEDYQHIINIQKREVNVKYMKLNNNSGPGVARNVGLEIATGEYVIFLDADDYIDSEIFNVLDKYEDYDIVVYDYSTFNNGNISLQESVLNSKCTLESIEDLMMRVSNSVWGKRFKKSIINANTVRFPELYKSEDLVFVMRYLKNCESFFYIQKPLYTYRISNTSLMHRNLVSQLENGQAALRILKRELLEYESVYRILYLREGIYDSINVLVRTGNSKTDINKFYNALEDDVDWTQLRAYRYFSLPQMIILRCVKYRLFALIRIINKFR